MKHVISIFLLISLQIIFINLKETEIDKSSFKKKIILLESDSDETSDNSKNKEEEVSIDISKIAPENLPQSEVLLPIRRAGTSKAEIGKGPCGGITKTLANTLTTKGSKLNVVWEVNRPELTGVCMVSLSKGLQKDKDFQVLYPIEGEFNDDGSFRCGREKGFEHMEFRLPEDYECDGCTLQWKWKTPYGNYYSCSDIIINGDSLSSCMGKCMNGGSCFNGKCLCTEGASGDYCENTSESSSKTWLWVLLGILGAGGVGVGGYYGIKKLMSMKGSKKWTTFEDMFGPKDNTKNHKGEFDTSGKGQQENPEGLIRNESQFQ